MHQVVLLGARKHSLGDELIQHGDDRDKLTLCCFATGVDLASR